MISGVLETVITSAAASVVYQNAATLFYCEAPELFTDFISSGGGEED